MPIADPSRLAEALQTTETPGFYAAAFAIGFVCSVARWYGQDSLVGVRIVVANSVGSGMVAFSSVAFLVNQLGTIGYSHYYFFGVAAVVGSLSKEQDKILKFLLRKFWKVADVLIDKSEEGK